ncbi:hypothetical protein GBA52_029173 [Prunus armeniaca]|nr:hypothetical protein GBA52_029173 [Prunus armeniaca]
MSLQLSVKGSLAYQSSEETLTAVLLQIVDPHSPTPLMSPPTVGPTLQTLTSIFLCVLCFST